MIDRNMLHTLTFNIGWTLFFFQCEQGEMIDMGHLTVPGPAFNNKKMYYAFFFCIYPLLFFHFKNIFLILKAGQGTVKCPLPIISHEQDVPLS
jgi:hypothetical protein